VHAVIKNLDERSRLAQARAMRLRQDTVALIQETEQLVWAARHALARAVFAATMLRLRKASVKTL
jgi:hypothetical protein